MHHTSAYRPPILTKLPRTAPFKLPPTPIVLNSPTVAPSTRERRVKTHVARTARLVVFTTRGDGLHALALVADGVFHAWVDFRGVRGGVGLAGVAGVAAGLAGFTTYSFQTHVYLGEGGGWLGL